MLLNDVLMTYCMYNFDLGEDRTGPALPVRGLWAVRPRRWLERGGGEMQPSADEAFRTP